MRTIRPPTTEPAVNGRILDWARQAQQTFRDIAAAFGEITIPRPKAQTTTAAVATQSETHPFQPYASAYAGTGTPPSDQARRLRIRPGFVVSGGQYLMPSNIGGEFIVPAETFQLFWLKVDLLHTGGTTSVAAAIIEQGEDIPSAESGSEPPTVYLHLFWATTGPDAITSFIPAQKTNAFGGMTVTNMSCAEIWREWRWNLNENVY